MKTWLFLLALLAILPAGFSQFYILDSHDIEINVDSGGNASVSEQYNLRFQNEQQISDFKQTASEIGVSLEGWRAYDSRLYPRIGQTDDVEVQGISFIENPSTYIEIDYVLKEPLMEKKLETSRVIDFQAKQKFFSQFVEGSFWVIPEGTKIIVNLPLGTEAQLPVKPDALVEGNTIIWTGYVSGNEFNLSYSYFKQIASFDFRAFMQSLFQSDLFLIVVAGLAVLGLVLFAKRKAISSRVEAYVEENSDLGGSEEE